MTKIKVGIHKDHRQRMKEKASEHGLKVLAEHEALELLLYYVVPYKDTNPLAHNLINQFGSFANVLDSDIDSLMMVPGVGLETARFLTFQKQFWETYMKSQQKNNLVFKSSNDIIKYFNKRFQFSNKEVLYVICLNNMGKLLQIFTYEGMNENKIIINVQKVHKDIVTSGASQIFLIHTHPNGSSLPSKEDEEFTLEMITSCYPSRIKINDHMIFSETSHSSMKDSIFKMYEEKGIDITIEPGKNKDFRFNS